jgi:hypothetical protein
MTGCSCLKNELSGMIWVPGERECILCVGLQDLMAHPRFTGFLSWGRLNP